MYTQNENPIKVVNVDADGNTEPIVPESVGDGSKTVTTPGTAVTLAAAQPCSEVVVTAKTNNVGIVVVGGSSVVAAEGSRRGTPLGAGDAMSLEIDDLSKVYIDATNAGEGVTYTFTA